MIAILVCGGTFDKRYDEIGGRLFFEGTHVPEMLRLGRSRVEVTIRTLMMIDSLEMTDADRALIVEHCRTCPEDRIVVTHGTDTMVETAAALAAAGRAQGDRPDGRDDSVRLRQLGWVVQPGERAVVRAGAAARGLHCDERHSIPLIASGKTGQPAYSSRFDGVARPRLRSLRSSYAWSDGPVPRPDTSFQPFARSAASNDCDLKDLPLLHAVGTVLAIQFREKQPWQPLTPPLTALTAGRERANA